MGRLIDLTGQKFGKLTVLNRLLINDSAGKPMWNCLCDCGNQCIASGATLRNGHSKSCGCLRIEKATKHGLSKTKLYGVWNTMKQRCENPNNQKFFIYGGLGVKVCEEWRNNFQAFYDWAMANGYADDLTIDRKDVNGNYCPENCRWVTGLEQANNKRNNRKITFNGETHTLTQWAKITGISVTTLWTRLYELNWSVEMALGKRGDAL